MNNVSLNRLNAFVAVVEAGSFTAAAEQLAQSKAVVSFNIKQLEAELGVSLLTRSTRRLELTDVGQRFYRDCQNVLREAQEAIDTARKAHVGLGGTLRITTTTEYGVHAVVPALAAFARENPLLEIRHASSSQREDLISERFDLAIRLGRLEDSSYRASLIETFDIVAVAAPDYLKRVPGKKIATAGRTGPRAMAGAQPLASAAALAVANTARRPDDAGDRCARRNDRDRLGLHLAGVRTAGRGRRAVARVAGARRHPRGTPAPIAGRPPLSGAVGVRALPRHPACSREGPRVHRLPSRRRAHAVTANNGRREKIALQRCWATSTKAPAIEMAPPTNFLNVFMNVLRQ
jgi:DNA-binding transcriptional LysR family regulator